MNESLPCPRFQKSPCFRRCSLPQDQCHVPKPRECEEPASLFPLGNRREAFVSSCVWELASFGYCLRSVHWEALPHGFAGDQAIHDQCDEPCRRHGVEDWEDPSESWIARRPSFQLTERHKVIYPCLHAHRFNFCQAFLQLAFQAQAREQPYQ